MQACWAQLGDVLKAERQFAFAALAREALRVMQAKLAKLARRPPAHRARPGAQPHRDGEGRRHGDGPHRRRRACRMRSPTRRLRRLTSPQRPVLKAAVRRAGASLPVGAQMAKMFTNPHAGGEESGRDRSESLRARRHPRHQDLRRARRSRPTSMRSWISRRSACRGRCAPGISRRCAIRRSVAATEAFRTRGRPLPSLTKIRAEGLVTETHLVRYVELAARGGRAGPLSVFTAELTKPTLQSAQGVVFSLGSDLGRPVLQMQPVRISPTIGTMTPILPARGRTTKRKAAALARIAPSDIARFGIDAVLESLPVNTVGLAPTAEPVTLELERAALAAVATTAVSPQIVTAPTTTTIATPVRPPATTTIAVTPAVVARPPSRS